jgi:hypothetical protein
MPLKDRFDATMNGLMAVCYLWLGIAILVASQIVQTIQTFDDLRRTSAFVCCLFFAVVCFIGLSTKIGLLRANNFTRDETIFPLAGVFALGLYLL